MNQKNIIECVFVLGAQLEQVLAVRGSIKIRY